MKNILSLASMNNLIHSVQGKTNNFNQIFQIWSKQPLQRGVSFGAAVAGGARGVPGYSGPHQQRAEEDFARQRQVAVLRLCVLLLHLRMLSLACHMS